MRKGTSALTNALFGIVLAALIIVFFVQCSAPFLKTQPRSEIGYNRLLEKFEQFKAGTTYAFHFHLEEKGSTLLFFNSDAKTLTDPQAKLVFQRPETCIGSCACNCPEVQVTTGQENRIVSCAAPPQTRCQTQPYTFLDAHYYDQDSLRNKGYALHNIDGGSVRQDLYVQRYGSIVILCNREPCTTPELFRLITFDAFLPGNLAQCPTQTQACAEALQNLNQLLDKDHDLEITQNTDGHSQLLLKQKNVEQWKIDLPFIPCITDQTTTQEPPFQLVWEPSTSKVLILNYGILKSLTAEPVPGQTEKGRPCLIYTSQ